MKAEIPSLFLSVEEAAVVAGHSSGLDIGKSNIHRLLEFAILPNFGTSLEPRILEEHARLFAGMLATEIELTVASLRTTGVPSGCDFDGHHLLQLCPQLAVSFDPRHHSITSLQAFIRALRANPELVPSRGGWQQTVTSIRNGPLIWASENTNAARWEAEWHVAESRDAKTTAAEALCVPMLFGSKGRLSSFVVSSIKQNLPKGAPICDLMAGTGLITRQLLSSFPVHANDAALFASRLSASQALDIDEPTVKAILEAMHPAFQENFSALTALFKPALELEEAFLLGGLSARRLAEYRDFASACTRFVPGYKPFVTSSIWKPAADEALRAQVEAQVIKGKSRPDSSPYVLATAYWGNCYFGLRQAAEIDSLRFALERAVQPGDRPLIEAVFLAAADACASGPHYAQPPKTDGDSQVRKLIEKRAKAVFPEFQLRLSLACKRPLTERRDLSVTNLPWVEALNHFANLFKNVEEKAVYVDPPYTRLQYSRFYHVFDTLLRYDYPACECNGRTSEKEKRFSSGFDRRESTVLREFCDLFRAVRDVGARLFLSYSTAGTVAVENLLALANSQFSRVQVYTAPLQHHSQGVPLKNRGHTLELLIAATP